jgi:RimJ/RimL family protein N-acetyltransferase
MTGNIDISSSSRIRFRRFTTEDVDLLYELDGDPEVMRYLSRDRTPREVIRDQTLPAILRASERYPGLGRFAAHDRQSDAFIGWFSLDVDGPEMATRPELGYRLHRRAWGQGLATEGSRAMMALAFADPAVEAVFAQTMAVNLRSRRVMEKLGMRHIRTFHPVFDVPLPGTEQGEVEYEITRAEWLLQAPSAPERG